MKKIIMPLIALIILISAIKVRDNWSSPLDLIIFLVIGIVLFYSCVVLIKLLERDNKPGELIFTKQAGKKKINIKSLKWVFLCLYILVIFCLLGLAYFSHLPDYMLYASSGHKIIPLVIALAVTVVTQFIFVFIAGKIDVKRPMKRWRLIFPVFVASVLLIILFMAAIGALDEAFGGIISAKGENTKVTNQIMIGVIILNWLFWMVVLFIKYKGVGNLKAIKGLVTNILSGSLLSLMISISAHIYVKRNSGCFVGMSTAMGVSAGIVVAFWAFGPGIIILFLEEKNKLKIKK